MLFECCILRIWVRVMKMFEHGEFEWGEEWVSKCNESRWTVCRLRVWSWPSSQATRLKNRLGRGFVPKWCLPAKTSHPTALSRGMAHLSADWCAIPIPRPSRHLLAIAARRRCAAHNAFLQRVERTRMELLADGGALTQFMSDFPHADAGKLSSLIRNIKKEQEQNKPPKISRALFSKSWKPWWKTGTGKFKHIFGRHPPLFVRWRIKCCSSITIAAVLSATLMLNGCTLCCCVWTSRSAETITRKHVDKGQIRALCGVVAGGQCPLVLEAAWWWWGGENAGSSSILKIRRSFDGHFRGRAGHAVSR